MITSVDQTCVIIDDDRRIVHLLDLILTMRGYTVATAATLTSGKELLMAELPDLVLVDVHLRDADGLDLCPWLRQRPGGEHVAVVVCTADHRLTTLLRALRSGADDVVTKPFGVEELDLRLQLAVARRNPSPAAA
jgi:DNA-binding response OmpR family regulator